MNQRRSIFISYARHDSLNFVRRLAFALSFYMDVFWDKEGLRTGPWRQQLLTEIEKRDYFVFVLSPDSIASESCKWEYEHAKMHKEANSICLAIRCERCDATEFGRDLLEFQGAGFIEDEDFELGFREITKMILGHPYSSWEFLSIAGSSEQDTSLLQEALKQGYVPGLIAKAFAEWLIIDQLWVYVETYISGTYDTEGSITISRGRPRTVLGVLRICQPVIHQFVERPPTGQRNFTGMRMVVQVRTAAELYVEQVQSLQENNHAQIGVAAYEIYELTRKFMEKWRIAERDFYRLREIHTWFDFNVTEKLRELVAIHARRSRYLY